MSGFLNRIKKTPPHSVIGLGMSGVSLGLGLKSYSLNKTRTEQSIHQKNYDEQSLKSLQKIHKALLGMSPTPPSYDNGK